MGKRSREKMTGQCEEKRIKSAMKRKEVAAQRRREKRAKATEQLIETIIGVKKDEGA